MAPHLQSSTSSEDILPPQNGHGHKNASDAIVDTTVLIVGGGPTGLLQAHLLANLGVQCMIVERYPERLGAPKAHALSPRSLEICRQSLLDVQAIRRLGTQRADAYWVNFLTSLSGEVVGKLPYERMDPDVLYHTPEMIHNIPQPDFEKVLTETLAQNSLVEIRKGVSFVSLKQTSKTALTQVEERVTGHVYQIRSRYVVACDGARSKVRDLLRIASEGEDSYETMMTIHFNANLRNIVGDRVGMLHWIMDPLASGFIIAYDLSGNAVLISNFDAEKHPVDSWNQELCREVVVSALGKDVPFDILSYRPWLLSRKVAEKYRSGRVFLAGDAAHSFPPTGGLGLNCGLADVHNLAYKIAHVIKGQATDSLLNTYESDRRHVAMVNAMQSVKNGKKIFALLKTMGIGGDLLQARASMYATLHDPEKRAEIDDGIEGQREHFDNLELHIGYVYNSKAVPDNSSIYVPKFVPGARLPHCWITCEHRRLAPVDVSYVHEFTASDVAARRWTSLDLIAPDRFTVLGPLTVPGVAAFCPGKDFDVLGEHGQWWLEQSGLAAGGSILVRPDQHILAIFDNSASADSVTEILGLHLGKPFGHHRT